MRLLDVLERHRALDQGELKSGGSERPSILADAVEALVGKTRGAASRCDGFAGLPRLGGPKNPRVAEIVALHPELVIANWEGRSITLDMNNRFGRITTY